MHRGTGAISTDQHKFVATVFVSWPPHRQYASWGNLEPSDCFSNRQDYTLEAFDQNNLSLGSLVVDDNTFDNLTQAGHAGSALEDRFIGFENATGISRFTLFGDNIEFDHVQYGANLSFGSVPEPTTAMFVLAGLVSGVAAKPAEPFAAFCRPKLGREIL